MKGKVMEKAKRTIIVVDMQNDFIDGNLGSDDTKAIVEDVANLLKEAKENGDNIIFTQDTHPPMTEEGLILEAQHFPTHCVKDTHGWHIIDELKEFEDDAKKEFPSAVVSKSSFSVPDWRSTRLIGEDDEIVVIGVCTDICVISNALSLRSEYPDNPIKIYENCTAGTSVELKEAALKIAKANLIDIDWYEPSN